MTIENIVIIPNDGPYSYLLLKVRARRKETVTETTYFTLLYEFNWVRRGPRPLAAGWLPNLYKMSSKVPHNLRQATQQDLAELTSAILSVRHNHIRVDPDFNTRNALYDDFLKNEIFNSDHGTKRIEWTQDDSV